MPGLWVPQRRGLDKVLDAMEPGKVVCLQGPTGSGKTVLAKELMRYAQHIGEGGVFYVNRTLLLDQTHKSFLKGGVYAGIRAANYDDMLDLGEQIQIASEQTERSRVYERDIWGYHDAKIVVVDEYHLQKSQNMARTIKHYRERGAAIVGLTATPVAMGGWADELVVSGKMQEYRDCGALVTAVCKSITEPDLSKVKRQAIGEYVLDGERKRRYAQQIVGDVIESWKLYNPDAKPTMLYAPGKPESVWFAQQFEAIGVRWAHVDATEAYFDGKRRALTRTMWEDIQGEYTDGKIKGLSCRFKLREGIDLPCTYHVILATPIGSVASFVQTVGRVLRYSPETPDSVLITDHGGNIHRHGSVNNDRPWELLWSMTEGQASKYHEVQMREDLAPESIVCPMCHTERAFGIKCPSCGFEHRKSVREVLYEDGRLETVEGRTIKPPRRREKKDTQKLWERMFWSHRRHTDRTWLQMEAYFRHKHGYYPTRDQSFMPKYKIDWQQKVSDTPMDTLIRKD